MMTFRTGTQRIPSPETVIEDGDLRGKHCEDMRGSGDSTGSEDSFGQMIEGEEGEMHKNRADRESESTREIGLDEAKVNKIIGLEEAKMWWKSIVGCFENPAEECEKLRQAIMEFIQMAKVRRIRKSRMRSSKN